MAKGLSTYPLYHVNIRIKIHFIILFVHPYTKCKKEKKNYHRLLFTIFTDGIQMLYNGIAEERTIFVGIIWWHLRVFFSFLCYHNMNSFQKVSDFGQLLQEYITIDLI